MKNIKGKYADAIIYTDLIEEQALEQVQTLCDNEVSKNSKIRIMPDVHAGKGCVIGLTMTYEDKVIPNLVGVDIGCGVTAVHIEAEVDFEKLEMAINKYIPSGFNYHKQLPERLEIAGERFRKIFDNLRCKDELKISLDKAVLSLGTLGGGNHFIEVGKDHVGNPWLFIHSGSRGIGNQVAQHYQKLAIKKQELSDEMLNDTIKTGIEALKDAGKESEIQNYLKRAKAMKSTLNPDLAYLEGQDMEDYLHDAYIMQKFAEANRMAMIKTIVDEMGFESTNEFSCHHNYIDLDNKIIRKGAISAQKNELVFIPLNMRDGIIVGIGRGNPDWNYSAPHGAGRILSRTQAKKNLTMDEFEDSMKDVWSNSVVESTLDEAPMTYKPMDAIIDRVDDTIRILDIIKPIYNYKAK